MTRDPAKSLPPDNALGFPFDVRQIMAGWNLLYLRTGQLAPDPSQSELWNRGRYLAEGLGHCASCHTPHTAFGAEDGGQHFGGGSVIDGWYVYPIDQNSPAPHKWDVVSLVSYLGQGFAQDHGAAAGPMAQVTAQLGSASPDDVKALATYVASQMGASEAVSPLPPEGEPMPPLSSGDSLTTPAIINTTADVGETVFATVCSSCHEAGRAQPFGGVDFANSTAINADSPQNVVNMVLFGLPAGTTRGPIMPGFAGTLSQDQIVALLGYLRGHFAPGRPAWSDPASLVADTLSGKTAVKTYSADGIERMPGAGAVRALP